jgi:RHS repeat-associated protein
MYADTAYAPFGETYASSGSTDPAFTSQRQDTVSGLYDFPAREYSIQGRWPSPDPAGFLAADYTNPQTWNAYAYALNNPVNFIDPLGLFTCGSIWVSCGAPASGDGGLGIFGLGWGDANPPLLYKGHGSGGTNSGTNPSNPNWCPPGDACDPTSNGGFNNNQEVKNCLNDYYNSKPGKAIEFGSVLSMVPGWDPDPGKNIIENIVLIGGKLLGLKGAQAAGQASVLSISGTSTPIAGPLEKLAGSAAGKVLAAAEEAGPYAVGGATVADILAHQACTMAAYPIPSVASPF